ncbi:perforin-1-like [Anguilla anguilla]|uniref:perforin-1-like n=1 Tax=Anguilla anguilla TaxID=7936 RepID=UPI0015B2A867|nr:perforin-1-like [Anguilla anguilla]
MHSITPAFWVGLLLSLSPPTSQSCSTGSASECKEAELAPGTNLAGEGFDITKMKRKGAYVIDLSDWKRKDKTCTICRNPYLEGKLQKLPLSVVDWRPNHHCSVKVASSLYQSSEALVSASSNSVENNWKSNLDVSVKKVQGSLMMAGSHSKLAEFSMEKTKKDKFSFTSHQVSCLYYSYRVSSNPRLHPEFRRAVKLLPKAYTQENKQRYYKLIDNFGTHYITKVELGGSVHSVTSIRQCQAALQGLSSEEVKTCLDVEAAASVGDNKLSTEVKHCKSAADKLENKAGFSSNFNDRLTEIRGGHTTEPELLFSANKDAGAYKEWLSSLTLSPDLVSYSLDALHELLPTSNPARQHLRKAISHYILENSLWKNCSAPCQAGIKTHPQDSCICSCHNNPGVTPDCCPSQKGLARVKVTVQKGTGLWGDYNTGTDGYVKLFHLKTQAGRTRVIYNNNNPDWNQLFDLGSVVLSMDDNVKFEVWDEDNKWDDDHLGECSVKLKAGVYADLCNLNHGQLYYKIEVTCAPSLGGPACQDYVGSPMNFHLEKAYVSRNARTVPREMLAKMGVFVDKDPLSANHSISSVTEN